MNTFSFTDKQIALIIQCLNLSKYHLALDLEEEDYGHVGVPTMLDNLTEIIGILKGYKNG